MTRAASLCLVLILLVAVGQVGCGPGSAPEPAPSSEEPTTAAAATVPAEEPTPAPSTPTPVPPAEETPTPTSTPVPPLEISSDAFEDQGQIPPRHGLCPDQTNLSPPLSWSNVPPDAQSLALICMDTDADFVHWVIYNVQATATGLSEGVPSLGELDDGALQGPNDYGEMGYGGPCPPPGETHTYVFTLYALDTTLDLPAGTDAQVVLQAAQQHIIAEAALAGSYVWEQP